MTEKQRDSDGNRFRRLTIAQKLHFLKELKKKFRDGRKKKDEGPEMVISAVGRAYLQEIHGALEGLENEHMNMRIKPPYHFIVAELYAFTLNYVRALRSNDWKLIDKEATYKCWDNIIDSDLDSMSLKESETKFGDKEPKDPLELIDHPRFDRFWVQDPPIAGPSRYRNMSAGSSSPLPRQPSPLDPMVLSDDDDDEEEEDRISGNEFAGTEIIDLSDSGSDSQESETSDVNEPVLSEKQKGKQRAISEELVADDYPTPRRTKSASQLVEGATSPRDSQRRRRQVSTQTPAPEIVGLPQYEEEEEYEVDLRGKMVTKTVTEGNKRRLANAKASKNKTRARTTFHPKKARVLKPNPDSETNLPHHFARLLESKHKQSYQLTNYKILSSTNEVVDLIDFLDLKSGFEVIGYAEPAVEGGPRDDDSIVDETEEKCRRKVRLFPQDRPRLVFTSQGFNIETRFSRFLLHAPSDDYDSSVKAARQLLNVWAFARSERVRGSYSAEEEEIEKVASIVNEKLQDFRASYEKGIPKWKKDLRDAWRFDDLKQLRLDSNLHSTLFDVLPNIPFVAPVVFKNIFHYLFPNSLRTLDAATLEISAQAERTSDAQLIKNLCHFEETWRNYSGKVEIEATAPLDSTAQRHPDFIKDPTLQDVTIEMFQEVKVNGVSFRVGEVVLVAPIDPKNDTSNISPDNNGSGDEDEYYGDDLDEEEKEDIDEAADGSDTKKGEEEEISMDRLWFARIESIFRSSDCLDDEDVQVHVTYFSTSTAVPKIGKYISPRRLFLLDSCATICASALLPYGKKIAFQYLKPGDRPPEVGFYCSSIYNEQDGSIQDLPTNSTFPLCDRLNIAQCSSCETDAVYTAATSPSNNARLSSGIAPGDRTWTPIQTRDDKTGSFDYQNHHYHPNDFVFISSAVQRLDGGSDRRRPHRLAQLIRISPEHDPVYNPLQETTQLGINSKISVKWLVRRSETKVDAAHPNSPKYEREVLLTNVIEDGIDVNRLEGIFNLHHLDELKIITECKGDVDAVTLYERQDPTNFWFTSRIDGSNDELTNLPKPIIFDDDETLLGTPLKDVQLFDVDKEISRCEIHLNEGGTNREKVRRVDEKVGGKSSYFRLRGLALYSGGGGLDLGLEIGCKALRTETAVEINKEAASIFRANHNPNVKVEVEAVSDYLEDVFFGRREREYFSHVSAGAPCQGFSSANRYKKIDDLRCLEPFVFLSSLAIFRPLFAEFENVGGFLTHALPENGPKRKSFFQLFIATAVDLGYQVRWSIYNAAAYGAPQSRRRLIVQFALAGIPLPKAPTPSHAFKGATFVDDHSLRERNYVPKKIDRTSSAYGPNPAVTISDAIADLPAFGVEELKKENGDFELRPFGRAWSSEKGSLAKYPSPAMTSYQLQARSDPRYPSSGVVESGAITSHVCATPAEAYLHRYLTLGIAGKNGKKGNYKDLEGSPFEPNIPEWLKHCSLKILENYWARLLPESILHTLRTTMNVDGASHGPRIHYSQARPLSLRELMRAQGLPDAFELIIQEAEPDSSFAEMIRVIGNGVPVTLAEAFGRSLSQVIYPIIDDYLTKKMSLASSAAKESLFERYWREICRGDKLRVDGRAPLGFVDDEDSDDEIEIIG